jgi:hypothetical protein
MTHTTCGSEPAREGVGTFSNDVTDTPLSRAGSLPQGIVVNLRDLQRIKKGLQMQALFTFPNIHLRIRATALPEASDLHPLAFRLS